MCCLRSEMWSPLLLFPIFWRQLRCWLGTTHVPTHPEVFLSINNPYKCFHHEKCSTRAQQGEKKKRKKKMKSQKQGRRNKWVFWKHFIKKIVSDMSSASQWKRCFTNPDSWMKWNIFSALFLGLELSIPTSRDTPHHICLSHRKNKKNEDFPAKKCCAFLGVLSLAEEESKFLCFSFTWQRVRGFSKDSSTRIYPAAPHPMGILLVFGSSGGKATNPSSKPRLELWDSTRGHWKGKVVPTAPPVLWHIQVWGALPCGKEIPLPVSSQCQNFRNNLTTPIFGDKNQLIIKAATKEPETTATRKCCSILLLKNPSAAAEPLKLYKSILPFQNSQFFILFPILFFVPGEGRTWFKEATQPEAWHGWSIPPTHPSLSGRWTKPKKVLPTGKSESWDSFSYKFWLKVKFCKTLWLEKQHQSSAFLQLFVKEKAENKMRMQQEDVSVHAHTVFIDL